MPFKELKIFYRHGKQYISHLKSVSLPEIFRGRPVISGNISVEKAVQMCSFCPVGAIGMNNSGSPGKDVAIDLGKCVFCRECEFAFPGLVTFSNDFRIATNRRETLLVTSDIDHIDLDPEFVNKKIRRIFRNALKLRQVSAAGDNSAEMELNAAGNVNFDMGRYGIEFVASPRHADGLVITGPISSNMAEALQITYDAIPSPKIVILAGTDAISGGVFTGSPALRREFLERYPVDLYVPGNPPHPLTFIHGVLDLIGRKF
jgi:Ni,Fe-hydrogenase III small subunit